VRICNSSDQIIV